MSRDGGRTFEVASGAPVISVVRSPTRVAVGGAVYIEGCPVGTSRGASRCDVIVRTADDGRTFEVLPPVSGPLYADARDADVAYATMGPKLLRWRRGDAAWNVIFTSPGDVLSVASDPSGALYVGTAAAIRVSRDAGQTFAALPPPPSAPRGLVARRERLFAFESLGVFRWEVLATARSSGS